METLNVLLQGGGIFSDTAARDKWLNVSGSGELNSGYFQNFFVSFHSSSHNKVLY
jgi:hypothetical protein